MSPPTPSFDAESYWRLSARRFGRHRLAVAGCSVIIALSLVSLLAPWLSPYQFQATDVTNLFTPPNARHWLGTDEVGQDVLTRLLYAGRVSLAVGFVTSIIAVTMGTIVGLVAGFYGGLWDRVLMRIADMLLALPTIALMFVLAKVLGTGLRSIIFVLAVLGWMGTARLVRAEVLRLKRLEFVDAARSLGASDARVLRRHLLANALAPVIVSATLYVGSAILSESTISYFGLGIQPPVPSWGNMLRNAQEYLWTASWLAIYPGVFIFVTVLSFNFMGDGLRDALDPRTRR